MVDSVRQKTKYSMRQIYLSDTRDLRRKQSLQENTNRLWSNTSASPASSESLDSSKQQPVVTGPQLNTLDEASLLSICDSIVSSPIYDPIRHDEGTYSSLYNSLVELATELRNENTVALLLTLAPALNGIIRQLASSDRNIRLQCLQCISSIAVLNDSVKTLISLNVLPMMKLLLDQILVVGPFDEELLTSVLLCLQLLFDVRTEHLFHRVIEAGFLSTFNDLLIQPTLPMKIKHSIVYATGNLAQYIVSEESHQLILPIIPAVIDVMYSTTISTIVDDCCWVFHFITSSYTLEAASLMRKHFLEQGVVNHIINYLYKSPLATCKPGLYLLRNLVYDQQTALAIHNANSRFIPFLFSGVLVSNLKVREVIYSIIQSLAVVDELLPVLMSHDLRRVIMQGLCTNSTKIIYSSIFIWGKLSQSPLSALDYDFDEIKALDRGLRLSMRASQHKNLIAGLHLIRSLIEESDRFIIEHVVGLDMLSIIQDLTYSANKELADTATQLLCDCLPPNVLEDFIS